MHYSTLQLHDYQKYFLEKMITKKRFGVFLRQGAGKTVLILEMLRQLTLKSEKNTLIIFAPLHIVYNVWPREIEKWQYPFSFHILHGAGLKEFPIDKDIYITTSDACRSPAMINFFNAVHPTIIVIDESTKFKNHTSNRFKAMQKLLYNIKKEHNKIVSIRPRQHRVYLLSGTPAPRSLLNLWPQMFLIDGGKSLSPYITYFKNKYFNYDHTTYTYHLKKDAKEAIYEKIKPFAESHDPQLTPEPTINNVVVAMPKDCLRTYRRLEKDFILSMHDGDKLVTHHIMSKRAKLRQLSGGACYVDDGSVYVHFDDKLDMLDDVIDAQQQRPLLVMVAYRHEVDRIKTRCEERKITCAVIDGRTSLKERDKIVALWDEKKLDVLIGQPESMSRGLNLQAGGSDICWYTPPDDLELYLQANARLDRQGQKEQVIIHHLITAHTQDVIVYSALEHKEDVQAALLAYLRAQIAQVVDKSD